MTARSVVVLDYGSPDARAAATSLEEAGAVVEITKDRSLAMAADGMFVTGGAAFAEVMRDLTRVRGGELIERRLAGGAPVFGAGVGMHILFDRSFADVSDGLGQWPGDLAAHEHEGWGLVDAAPTSTLFAGLAGEQFHFDHVQAAFEWTLDVMPPFSNATLSWAERGGRFIAAVENGPLVATQFRPQDSGEAGVRLLRNWLASLTPKDHT